MNDPQPDFQPIIGQAEQIAADLRRIVAPNPSPMTFRGTNTYLLGHEDIAVIDPGPADEDHLENILTAVQPNQKITHIFVTHAHLDHSPLARRLSEATGAQVYAFSDALGGRSEVMIQLAKTGLVGGGEGVDAAFVPDIELDDGDTVSGSDWSLTAVHTPGHFSNHLSFALGDRLFCGDHVMGWASSLVSPPDGDLTQFMASCARLRVSQWSVFYPGHGAQIDDPGSRLEWLVKHRQSREAAIIAALEDFPDTATGLAARIYTDTPSALLPAASRNVLAHLVDLYEKSRVSPHGELRADAMFELT